LHLFFQYLGRKVISEVDLSKPLESVFYGYARDTINKYWVEYEKILSHYVDEAAIIGNVHYDILLEASKDKAKHFKATKARNRDRTFLDNELNVDENRELFAPNPKVSSRLKRYKFEASDKTIARVDKEINQILGEAYREGWGPRDVGDKIRQRFTDLSTYEARRIAQTEINTTRNYVQYQRMQDDEMEYKIWHAAHDSRTRKSHIDVDEEIVPINERFSNGLMYPGDKEGPISEWVNCRCSHAAYIMPLGYQAPDFFPFKESDLVKVGSSLSQDYVSEIQQRIRLIDGAMVREQQENTIEIPVDTSKMSIEEIARHYGCEHEIVSLQIGNYSKPKTFHKLTETFEDGRKLDILFEKETLTTYNRVPVNEIIDEIFKVPKVCRNETSRLWFKNNNDGICKRGNKNGIDTLGKTVGGYNTSDYDHKIVMNPKFFKVQKRGSEAELMFNMNGFFSDEIHGWKKTLHHEFIHSLDLTKATSGRRSFNDEKWIEAERAERTFTSYANTETVEAYAEHGGYYSYMKSNPKDHELLIEIKDRNRQKVKINFEEYKKRYPKHVEYFEETLYSNKVSLENEQANIRARIRELNNLIDQTELHIQRLEATDTEKLIAQYRQYQKEMMQQIKDAHKHGPRDLIPLLREEYEMYKQKIEELKQKDSKQQIEENKKKLKEYKAELQDLKRRLR